MSSDLHAIEKTCDERQNTIDKLNAKLASMEAACKRREQEADGHASSLSKALEDVKMELAKAKDELQLEATTHEVTLKKLQEAEFNVTARLPRAQPQPLRHNQFRIISFVQVEDGAGGPDIEAYY